MSEKVIYRLALTHQKQIAELTKNEEHDKASRIWTTSQAKIMEIMGKKEEQFNGYGQERSRRTSKLVMPIILGRSATLAGSMQLLLSNPMIQKLLLSRPLALRKSFLGKRKR